MIDIQHDELSLLGVQYVRALNSLLKKLYIDVGRKIPVTTGSYEIMKHIYDEVRGMFYEKPVTTAVIITRTQG